MTYRKQCSYGKRWLKHQPSVCKPYMSERLTSSTTCLEAPKSASLMQPLLSTKMFAPCKAFRSKKNLNEMMIYKWTNSWPLKNTQMNKHVNQPWYPCAWYHCCEDTEALAIIVLYTSGSPMENTNVMYNSSIIVYTLWILLVYLVCLLPLEKTQTFQAVKQWILQVQTPKKC